ncbi:MAG: DUF1631 family protein [Lautropia sp.]|nr:DUF1631 family protein [Lautropia sp.]
MSSRIDPSLYPRLHERLADLFGKAVYRLLPELADALQAYAADGLDANVAARLTDTARLLREEASVRADVAVENFVALDLGTMGDESSLPLTVGELDRGNLSGDTLLLEQILARELANAIRTAFGGSYLNYLRRLEALAETPLRDDQHPLGARALAMALVMSLKPFSYVQPTSLHLRPMVLSMAVQPLARLLADCDAELREAEVLPELEAAALQLPAPRPGFRKTLKKHKRALVAGREESYTGIFPADDGGNTFVRHASHQVLKDIRASAVMAANPLASRRHRLSGHRKAAQVPQIEDIERDAVVFARQCNVVPFSHEARTEFFTQVRRQVIAAGGDTHILAVIDLVASLFDYAASDRRLPEGARILLWRLQMPAITLASLDAGYLGDDSRSIRRLVEQVAAIATSYPDEMRPNKPLYQRLQTVVRAVEIVAHAFHIRSQVLSEQVDHEYRRATQGMRQLLSKLSRSHRGPQQARPRQANRRNHANRPSAAREKTVSEDIRRLLDHRIGNSRVPESVSIFLYDVWLRHLRTAVLRDGSDSQNYRLALQVVDDLLWTLGQEGADPRVRNELIQSIPPMLDMLTIGIREVGEKPERFRDFFDEIFLIHVRRMQGEGGSAATVIEQAREADLLPSAAGGSHAAHFRSQAAQTPPAARSPQPQAESMSAGAPHAHAAAVAEHPQPPGAQPAALDPASSAAASQRLQALIRNTSLDDLPREPRRFNLPAERFAAALHTGRWLELISRSGRVDHAKVVWINDRKTMVLLLLASDRRIMTREISSLLKRVRQGRLHFIW